MHWLPELYRGVFERGSGDGNRHRYTIDGWRAIPAPRACRPARQQPWKSTEKNASPDDLLREVVKDKAYFQKSGGGVTLSGGEPTMQPLFTRELLAACQRSGLHTALDTCGQCSWETLEALLPHTDMIMYDLKEIDPDKHKKFTGISNTRNTAKIYILGLLR